MLQISTQQPRTGGDEALGEALTVLYYHEIKEFLRWLGLSRADFCHRTRSYHPDTMRRWGIYRHGRRITPVVERQLRDYVDGMLGVGMFVRSVARWQREKPRYLRMREQHATNEAQE